VRVIPQIPQNGRIYSHLLRESMAEWNITTENCKRITNYR
jgi:hypothetical protein